MSLCWKSHFLLVRMKERLLNWSAYAFLAVLAHSSPLIPLSPLSRQFVDHASPVGSLVVGQCVSRKTVDGNSRSEDHSPFAASVS